MLRSDRNMSYEHAEREKVSFIQSDEGLICILSLDANWENISTHYLPLQRLIG